MNHFEEFDPSAIDCLVGIVRVNLEALSFPDGREVDSQITNHLSSVFTRSSSGCDRNTEENYIPAILSSDELVAILVQSQLSREALYQTIQDKSCRPIINIQNSKLHCLHGKHRIEAAKRILEPEESWWTVKLFLFNSQNCQAAGFILKQGESFSHQTKFSDGEIYRKVRYHQTQHSHDLVEDWMLRLGPWKQQHLKQMLGHPEPYQEAFDDLLHFPGLWCGLELGNIRRHLALHCHEELINYLRHVHKVWSAITQEDPLICRALDINTVRSLQMRAPTVCLTDRQFVIQGMDNGTIFSKVTDKVRRDRIKQTLLQLTGLIPTIKSFHENVKLLETAVKIVKRLLFNNRVPRSIYHALESIWTNTGRAIIETSEARFQYIDVVPEYGIKHIAYVQIFLAALRNFPQLSYDSPRKERGKATLHGYPDLMFQYQFLKRAQLLGYQNEHMANRLHELQDTIMTHHSNVVQTGNSYETIERRWGRPFERSHTYLRSRLFLGHLGSYELEIDVNPTTMFVQRETIQAFFGYTSVNIQAATPAHLVLLHETCQNVVPSVIFNSPRTLETRKNEKSLNAIPQVLPLLLHAVHYNYDFGPPRESILSPPSEAAAESETPSSSTTLPQCSRFSPSPSLQELTLQLRSSNMRLKDDDETPSDVLSAGQVSEAQLTCIVVKTIPENIQNTEPGLEMTTPLVSQLDTCMEMGMQDGTATSLDGTVLAVESPDTTQAALDCMDFVLDRNEKETQQDIVTPGILLSFQNEKNIVGTRTHSPIARRQKLSEFELSPSGEEVVKTCVNAQKPLYNTTTEVVLHQSLSPTLFFGEGGDGTLGRISDEDTVVGSDLDQPVWQPSKGLTIEKITKSSTLSTSSPPAQRRAICREPYSKTSRAKGSSPKKHWRSHATPRSRAKSKQLDSFNKTKQKQSTAPRSLLAPYSRQLLNVPIRESTQEIKDLEDATARNAASQRHQSYLVPEHGMGATHMVHFIEHNGTRISAKATMNMAAYLNGRRGWVAMIVENMEAKTIRTDYITGYIANGNLSQSRTLVLVDASYAENFRLNPAKWMDKMLGRLQRKAPTEIT